MRTNPAKSNGGSRSNRAKPQPRKIGIKEPVPIYRELRLSAKQKLKEGGVCLGHIVMEFASPGLVTILANAQFDFVLFDTEHTRFSIETIGGMIRYARSAGLPAIVRVPRGQYDQMSRIMDAGADGIMAPNVQSRAEAESIIQATKYAPLGNRGTAFGIAHDDFEMGECGAFGEG